MGRVPTSLYQKKTTIRMKKEQIEKITDQETDEKKMEKTDKIVYYRNRSEREIERIYIFKMSDINRLCYNKKVRKKKYEETNKHGVRCVINK